MRYFKYILFYRRGVQTDDMLYASAQDGTMRHYTGYRATELRELAGRLNRNTANPAHKQLSTIRTKYSHR